jgi:hypothetical protein
MPGEAELMSAAPQPGDVYLHFNGIDNYVEIPSSDAFSISTSGELSVSAWLRPDVLNFPASEGSGYVHWMGKGETGQAEWTLRIYSHSNTETPPRPNRISFYVFNPEGGLGVGSYFQDPIVKGGWIHVVGIAGSAQTYIYKDGSYRRCDTYRGPATGGCPIHKQPGSGDQLVIDPQPGSAPLRIGTRDFGSFFKGGMQRVRIWNRAIQEGEVQGLFASDTVPQAGLVAEYLLNRNTGDTAADTADGHDGLISGAEWRKQH